MKTSGNSLFAHLEAAVLTDVGRKRKNNEDSFGEFPESGVWCVADGMGGGDDGEVASSAVIKAIEERFDNLAPLKGDSAYPATRIAGELDGAIRETSKWVYDRAKEKNLNGCGSTVVGAIFDPTNPGEAIAFHAGDSRLYRLRGNSLKQITTDHSVAEMMGQKEEKKLNPLFRGMIMRAVGIERDVQVEFTKFSVKEGDVVLICSDGLTRMIADKQIAGIIRSQGCRPKDAADELVAAANEAGGVDNITVELIRVGKLPEPVEAALVDMPEQEESDTLTTGVEKGKPLIDKLEEFAERLPWNIIGLVAAALGIIVFTVVITLSVTRNNRESEAGVIVPDEGTSPTQSANGVEPGNDGNAADEEMSPKSNAGGWKEEKGDGKSAEAPGPEVGTVAEAIENAPPAEDAAVAEEATPKPQPRPVALVSEREAAQAALRELRLKRERAEAAAAEAEDRLFDAARELAGLYHREEFKLFLKSIEKDFGRDLAVRLQTLALSLYQQRKDDSVCDAAAQFASEMCRWAEKAGSRKPVNKELRDFAGANPESPQTQKRCIDIINSIAARLMEEYGRENR